MHIFCETRMQLKLLAHPKAYTEQLKITHRLIQPMEDPDLWHHMHLFGIQCLAIQAGVKYCLNIVEVGYKRQFFCQISACVEIYPKRRIYSSTC